MICPKCHYLDDKLPNCLVCGGRGTLGEEVADTDGTDSTDLKKEDAVKTFAERLQEFKVIFPEWVAMHYDGRPVVLAEAQATLRDTFALQSACEGQADVTTVQRTLVWAAACMCLRRKSRFFSADAPTNQNAVAQWLSPVMTLLAKKNASYGNTALAPIRCFAKGRALALLACRIDDKISRILKAQDAFGEDALADLAGYLVLYWLALEDESNIRDAMRAESAKGEETDTDSTDGTDLHREGGR